MLGTVLRRQLEAQEAGREQQCGQAVEAKQCSHHKRLPPVRTSSGSSSALLTLADSMAPYSSSSLGGLTARHNKHSEQRQQQKQHAQERPTTSAEQASCTT